MQNTKIATRKRKSKANKQKYVLQKKDKAINKTKNQFSFTNLFGAFKDLFSMIKYKWRKILKILIIIISIIAICFIIWIISGLYMLNRFQTDFKEADDAIKAHNYQLAMEKYSSIESLNKIAFIWDMSSIYDDLPNFSYLEGIIEKNSDSLLSMIDQDISNGSDPVDILRYIDYLLGDYICEDSIKAQTSIPPNRGQLIVPFSVDGEGNVLMPNTYWPIILSIKGNDRPLLSDMMDLLPLYRNILNKINTVHSSKSIVYPGYRVYHYVSSEDLLQGTCTEPAGKVLVISKNGNDEGDKGKPKDNSNQMSAEINFVIDTHLISESQSTVDQDKNNEQISNEHNNDRESKPQNAYDINFDFTTLLPEKYIPSKLSEVEYVLFIVHNAKSCGQYQPLDSPSTDQITGYQRNDEFILMHATDMKVLRNYGSIEGEKPDNITVDSPYGNEPKYDDVRAKVIDIYTTIENDIK